MGGKAFSAGKESFLPWMLQIMARLLGRFLLENSEAECVGEQLGAFLLIEVETVRISLWMWHLKFKEEQPQQHLEERNDSFVWWEGVFFMATPTAYGGSQASD